jgi:hypothetical protein
MSVSSGKSDAVATGSSWAAGRTEPGPRSPLPELSPRRVEPGPWRRWAARGERAPPDRSNSSPAVQRPPGQRAASECRSARFDLEDHCSVDVRRTLARPKAAPGCIDDSCARPIRTAGWVPVIPNSPTELVASTSGRLGLHETVFNETVSGSYSAVVRFLRGNPMPIGTLATGPRDILGIRPAIFRAGG